MKKIISVFFALIIFISVTLLIIILNINTLSRYEKIEKISSKIDYLSLVDIKAEDGRIKQSYDAVYENLKLSLSNEVIKEIYNSSIPKKITTEIIYKEISYLFFDKNIDILTKKEVDKILIAYINKTKFKSDIKEGKIIDIITSNDETIIKIEKDIRKSINQIPIFYQSIIRYIFSNSFKIILLCLIIISIIIEYLINKTNYIPYLFIPTILSSIIQILVSLFLVKIISIYITHELILKFIPPYLEEFKQNLVLISLATIFISIIILMFNEIIDNKGKVIIKPKLFNKKNKVGDEII